ncbi:MAG: hypothetical protein K0S35_1634 [Geminicoccaceae bacterium]|nr:hypothetical protein [Geminicoccaceae bacterium]
MLGAGEGVAAFQRPHLAADNLCPIYYPQDIVDKRAHFQSLLPAEALADFVMRRIAEGRHQSTAYIAEATMLTFVIAELENRP